jgi:hypothetical protein
VAQASVSLLGFYQSNLMVVRGILEVKLGALLKCRGQERTLEVVSINRTIINFAILRRPPVPSWEMNVGFP